MTNNNLLKFLNRVSSDTKFMSEFFANKSSEDLHKFALSHSEGGFSKEELQESLDIMEIYANKFAKGELSENDLQNVSGGAGEESNLRSYVMLTGHLVNLIISAGQLLTNYFSTKSKYNNEQDKLRIAQLEERLKKLNKSSETQE